MAKVGDGSGRGSASAKLGDFTKRGIATRFGDDPPTDQDWVEGAPPNGTFYWQGEHTLWVRLNDTWHGKLMEWDL